MSIIEPLKEGQEVFLKQPLQIYAKVIGPCEGDLDLPQEQVRYAVQLLPLVQYYLAQDLEAAQQPQAVNSRQEFATPETLEEPAQPGESGPNLSASDPFFDLAREIHSRIAGRAYELYEGRGFARGLDAEDWLLAESEILQNVPAEITETETQLTIRAGVPGFTENELEVRVVPRSVCITGKKQAVSERMEEKSAGSERRAKQIFRVLDLPCEVDPSRVVASAGRGVLEVKLVKVGSRKVVPVRAKAASA
jgi:HSP20 family protein